MMRIWVQGPRMKDKPNAIFVLNKGSVFPERRSEAPGIYISATRISRNGFYRGQFLNCIFFLYERGATR